MEHNSGSDPVVKQIYRAAKDKFSHDKLPAPAPQRFLRLSNYQTTEDSASQIMSPRLYITLR